MSELNPLSLWDVPMIEIARYSRSSKAPRILENNMWFFASMIHDSTHNGVISMVLGFTGFMRFTS